MLEEDGFDVTYLPVQRSGLVDLRELEAAIRPDTVLVSTMAVNNEIGVMQPITEIGRICRQHKVFFHTDAAQAFGKIPLDVNAANIDLMSISGHKIYGPKGIGALYVRRKPRVRLQPIISGGGQERGMRSGTLPAPLLVGFGAAAELCLREQAYDHAWISRLSKRLVDGIMARIPHVIRNGDASAAYPGCVNLSFAYVEGEALLMGLKEVALSSGSACTSESLEPSYVLRAIGAEEDLAHSRCGRRWWRRAALAPQRADARHAAPTQPPLRHQSLYDGTGSRLCHRALRTARQSAACHVTAVGDGSGGR